MYAWIWRHLPWPLAAQERCCALVLALAVVALLFTVVFPWAEPAAVPDVTVDQWTTRPR